MSDAAAIIEKLDERELRERLARIERERSALMALIRAKRTATKRSTRTERGGTVR